MNTIIRQPEEGESEDEVPRAKKHLHPRMRSRDRKRERGVDRMLGTRRISLLCCRRKELIRSVKEAAEGFKSVKRAIRMG